MATQLEDLVGAKLVIGFPGTKVTPDVIRQFKETHAGGVIFYRINFESPAQIRQVISDLEAGLGRKLLVCVDHEGGRVIMYRDGVTIWPDNLAIGKTNKPEFAKKVGEIAAKELRALGTDVNFAPVLDVLTKSYSPNIGIRSFGEDWKMVGEFGAAYIRALQAGGVSATAKHFPGKGHAPVDAHLKLPTILSSWAEMKEVHLQPFITAIEAGVDVIMSSHPRYPKLDPNTDNIATFSRRIMHDCLRSELGFKGILSSDDLEMGAVKEVCPIGLAAVKTAAAGHDLILSCHSLEDEKSVFNGLLEAYKTKQLPLRELEASVERIENLKAKRPQRFAGPIGPVAEGAKLAAEISSASVTILQDRDKMLPLPESLKNDVAIIFPELSSFAKKIMIEKEFEDETVYFDHLLGKYPVTQVTEVYGITPSDEDIENSCTLARRSGVTIFFCFDAHLFPAQEKLLGALQQTAKKLVVVLLRDPYDVSFLRPKDVGITAYGFRKCQIEAIIDRIFQ